MVTKYIKFIKLMENTNKIKRKIEIQSLYFILLYLDNK